MTIIITHVQPLEKLQLLMVKKISVFHGFYRGTFMLQKITFIGGDFMEELLIVGILWRNFYWWWGFFGGTLML